MIPRHKLDRLLFTLGVIVIYRFATYLTIPGLDEQIINTFYAGNSTILGMFNSMSGGAISRMSIMALNLMPYISASIIMQLLTSVIPEWKALKKDSYQKRKLNRYSRVIALLISFVQALAIAIGLENVPDLVLNPGLLFKATAVISIMSGSVLIMWLSEKIGEKGLGNGSSIVIFTGIVANATPNLLMSLQKYFASSFNIGTFSIFMGLAVAFFLIILFCEMLRYYVKIFFKRSALVKYSSEDLSANVVPLKINPAGILPAMFADSLMIVPALIMRFLAGQLNLPIGGYAPYITLFLKMLMIGFFSVFCLSFVMNPEDIAEHLSSRNAYIDQVPEGTKTALYFTDLLNKISVIGCIYLIFATIAPDLFSLLYFGGQDKALIVGTSIMIVIGVAIDIYGRLASRPVTKIERLAPVKNELMNGY